MKTAFGFLFALALMLMSILEAPGQEPLTLRLYSRHDIVSFDPAIFSILTIKTALFETLYQYSYLSDPISVSPLLAQGPPHITNRGLTVTIQLKKGTTFADDPCFKSTHGKGREVIAQDFVYSLKRLALPQFSESWWVLDGRFVGMNTFRNRILASKNEDLRKIFDEPVEGIRATGPHTLQLILTHPIPQLLYLLSLSPTSVVPFEAVEAYAGKDGRWDDHPVGTGPFLLGKWIRDQQITLVRNPHYHLELYPRSDSPDSGKPVPFLNKIIWRTIKEESSAWLEFLKGNLDLIEVPKDALTKVMDVGKNKLSDEFAARKTKLVSDATYSIVYIAFNMKDPILGTNKLLRQALSSAIDRHAWSQLFWEGTASKMTVPPAGSRRQAC